MIIYTTKEKLENNTELIITFDNDSFNKLRIVSSSYYTLFVDGKVFDFGPVRSATGYARVRELDIPEHKSIYIKVIYYGVPTFEFADESFYFGVELLNNNQPVCSSFKCRKSKYHVNESGKFSFQRAFIERYDLTKNCEKEIEMVEKESPFITETVYKNCNFEVIKSTLVETGEFKGFSEVYSRQRLGWDLFKDITHFDLEKDFLDIVKGGYSFERYELERDLSGLIKLNIDSKVDNQKIFVVYEEFLPDGKWIYGRQHCTELIEVNVSNEKNTIVSNVPYTMKHIMVIHPLGVKCVPSLILIQNDLVREIPTTNNKKADEVINAARNTFMQNAYDIFTDCPSRERAGWLCDSYFEGLAESFYTGNRNIERRFLENFIYSNCPDIPNEVLPMCYPSRHIDHTFIPNWVLWFVVELEKYYKETGDKSLVDNARKKVDEIFKYFSRYETKEGLLINLESWVFVEWSKANDDEYLKGINFPTNMLYAGALLSAGNLYKDNEWIDKANKLKEVINKYSYNSKHYVDNAEYVDGKITLYANHISETCQYYALFFGINKETDFIERTLNRNIDESLAPAAPFIGKILRVLLLERFGKNEQIVDEVTTYFYPMADSTKTLWEKASPQSSCNHGFASIVGPVLYKAINNIKKS